MKTQKLIATTFALVFFAGINLVFADAILVQTISFDFISDKKTTSRDFQLNAISDSLLPVTYSRVDNSGDNACDVTEQGLVHIIKEGICTIKADQVGDATYLPAIQISRTFNIFLPGPNQASILVDTKFATIQENQSFTGTFSGSDTDDDLLTFSATKPTHGTISNITFRSNNESTFTYTPDKNYHGKDTFTFKANDGKIDSDSVTGTINIEYVPQEPEINLLGDNPLRINLGDTYTEPGASAVDENGNNLTTFLNISGSVDTNTVGDYTITYSVDAINGLSNSITRTVQVRVKNDAPIVTLTNPINNSTISGTINLNASYSDDNAVTGVLFYVDGVATSTTLNTNYLTNATHTISVVVSDSEPLYATSSVSVRVNNVAVVSTSSGGGGGGGGGSYVPAIQSSTTNTQVTVGSVGGSGTATTTKQVGKVLGVSIFNFKKNLSFGMNNNDVKELQKVLISLKFMTVTANGNFGPATKKALIAWQKSNNLPPTGYFGPMSRELMNK